MITFFDLKKLEELSCNNASEFMTYLYYHSTKRTARSTKELKYTNKQLQGYSYLLNPEDLFDDKHTDILYKIQYVKLAGMRDYLLFKQYRYLRLQTSYFPDLNYEVVKHNPLLTITNNEVQFRYEERY